MARSSPAAHARGRMTRTTAKHGRLLRGNLAINGYRHPPVQVAAHRHIAGGRRRDHRYILRPRAAIDRGPSVRDVRSAAVKGAVAVAAAIIIIIVVKDGADDDAHGNAAQESVAVIVRGCRRHG